MDHIYKLTIRFVIETVIKGYEMAAEREVNENVQKLNSISERQHTGGGSSGSNITRSVVTTAAASGGHESNVGGCQDGVGKNATSFGGTTASVGGASGVPTTACCPVATPANCQGACPQIAGHGVGCPVALAASGRGAGQLPPLVCTPSSPSRSAGDVQVNLTSTTDAAAS